MGDFDFQPKIMPGAAAEDALHLRLMNIRIGVNEIGRPPHAFFRPVKQRRTLIHGLVPFFRSITEHG